MGSGSIVNKWMLEFAISDLKDDGLITKMLSVFPMLEDDVGLKKMVLLRSIESQVAEFAVSEKTLDALEIAFELDRKEGFNVLESRKTAYCSVAVDCLARVVNSTGEGEMYLDVVKRIWRKRIGRLFAHNVDLVSKQLETWRDNIEAAICDNNLRSQLFGSNTRYEALLSVKEYLNEAWETVGPRFTSCTFGKSLVEAQLLCLQTIREPGKADARRSFDIPWGSGDSYNPTAQFEGKVLKGPRDPSSLVSSPLLKNKDQESLANTLNQNQGHNSKNITGNKPEESKAFHSTNTVNLSLDGTVKLGVSGMAREQNLLQTSYGLIQDQPEKVEPVIVKGMLVEGAASPLPGVCGSNSCEHVDHVKGTGINVDKEQIADLPREDTRKVGGRRKEVGGTRKLSERVRINDSEDVDLEGSNIQHDSLSETEVIKVLEESKASSRELQDGVKDPLPDVLHVIQAVLSYLARNCAPQGTLAGSISETNTLKSCNDKVERGNDEALASHKNDARTSGMEGNAINLKNYETDPIHATNNVSSPFAVGHLDNNLQNELSGHENLQRRANLCERNPSSQIYERISESGKAKALRSFNTPWGSGDSYNPTAQFEGNILKGHRDPSSLVSSPLLKNKDLESLANTLNQNQGHNSKNITGNKLEEGSKAFHSKKTENLCQGGIVKLDVSCITNEKNLLPTSYSLIQDQPEKVEPALVKGMLVEGAASPLPGVCGSNSCEHVDHVKGTRKIRQRRKRKEIGETRKL